jgi:hypothetical protein
VATGEIVTVTAWTKRSKVAIGLDESTILG